MSTYRRESKTGPTADAKGNVSQGHEIIGAVKSATMPATAPLSTKVAPASAVGLPLATAPAPAPATQSGGTYTVEFPTGQVRTVKASSTEAAAQIAMALENVVAVEANSPLGGGGLIITGP